jgi:hypothetical protein
VTPAPPLKKADGGRVKVHFGLVLATILCTPAFIFELSRALEGNTLSWAYVFEWPIFEAFAVYMWWKLLHEDEIAAKPKKVSARAKKASAADQIKLDAWNSYLKDLAQADSETQD